MTGFGAAATHRNGYVVSSEIKTVNNRYLKTAYRISDGFSSLETKIEALLRQSIDRGTVNVTLRIRPEEVLSRYTVTDAPLDYILSGEKIRQKAAVQGMMLPLGNVADYIRLPGGMADRSEDGPQQGEDLWEAVEVNLKEALTALDVMRLAEGDSMQKNLRALCAGLTERIGQVEAIAPQVAESYRKRLTERIGKIMADHQLELNPADLVREVALFTDKADISEETVRFRSHLAQFDAAMNRPDPCGKRLDFLTQELFRETNTIGSKANEPAITNLVVDMKTEIEKIREMVQNVE